MGRCTYMRRDSNTTLRLPERKREHQQGGILHACMHTHKMLLQHASTTYSLRLGCSYRLTCLQLHVLYSTY